MPATRSVIEGWLREARDQGATHLVVRCDSFDYRGGASDSCCYPVYVMPGEDVRKITDGGGDRLMEVYSMRLTDEYQLRESRAFHYD